MSDIGFTPGDLQAASPAAKVVEFSTQTIGTQQGGGQTAPVMAHLASRYLDEYGLSPASKYVALRATSQIKVGRSGAVLFGDSTFAGSGSNIAKFRGTGQADFPTSDPKSWTRSTLTIDGDYGVAVELDTADDSLRDLLGADGADQGALDELGVALSVNELLKLLDTKLLTLLTAGTSPFDATDVDAASADWNDATTAIVANFESARRNFGGLLTAAIWDEEAESYFRGATEMATRYGGNVGFGGIGEAGVDQALSTFGIRARYTVPMSGTLGDKVILYQAGQTGPTMPMQAGALVLAHVPQPGEDEYGISYSVRQVGDGRIWRYVAWMRAGFFVNSARGVRIKNVF